MEKPEEIKVEEEKLLEQDVESVPDETPEEEVVKSEPEAKEDKIEAVKENPAVPEAKPEGEELEQESKEESSNPVDDNDNKNDEAKDEAGTVEEEKATQPDKATDPNETVEPDKETEGEEEDKFEEKVSPEQAELIAQLEELRAEKEDREALEACNKEVMKVEEEFNQCTNKIAEALRTSFAQNDIDPTKSLEELRKENPAKATLAEQFIRQATELKANLERAAMEEVAKHQNEVIYRVASREFVKMGLNLEQAKNAVATFKRIVNEIGVTDLGDDLKMKVQLAAGRAKIVVPEVEPDRTAGSETTVDNDTTGLKEPSPEKEKVEPAEEPEKEKDVPPTPVVEKPSEPVVQKPKVEDFEEGVTGKTSVNAGTMINELNVLDELAKLPYRERAKFYKEHEDVIVKALSKRG